MKYLQKPNITVIQFVTYTDACRSIVNTIMTNGHSSLEKYTFHTLFEMVAKGLCVRGELETEQRLQHIDPSSYVFSITSFSFCWTAHPEARKDQPSAESWFSLPRTATTDSKLTELPVTPGYIIAWRPVASCGRHICSQFNPSIV